jgi:group I intron endonuclease
MNIAKNFGKESLTLPGAYQIVNKLNGHKYIGSSINIWTRWGHHLSDLRKNKHDNNYLQNAWNKYGEDNFEFGVLLFCDADNTFIYEQSCLDGLKPEYNIAIDAFVSRKGLKHSDETKEKMSKAALGNKNGVGNKNTLGRKLSDYHKAKISESLVGNKRALGNTPSDEARTKMSNALLGNTRTLGYKHSEESKEKMSKSRIGNTNSLGHKHSDETKAKMRESAKRRCLREKDLIE